jgi:hypothetical protein
LNRLLKIILIHSVPALTMRKTKSICVYTQSKDNVANTIWKRFVRNKLWKAHLASPRRSVSLICLDFTKQQVDKWCAQKSSSRRALRSDYGYDPIFFSLALVLRGLGLSSGVCIGYQVFLHMNVVVALLLFNVSII